MVDPTSAIGRARTLRRDVTETERWPRHRLRDRRLGGHRCVRQLPVGPFFADVGCSAAELTVGLDGSQQAENLTDARRDAFLIAQGYGVPRFWNHDVAADIVAVRGTILAAVEKRLAPFDRFEVP